jgi:hypothetical protein
MLSTQPYYFATTRKAISVFGSLFKDIEIERVNDTNGEITQTIKIPLSYSPKEKYILRAIQEPDIDGKMVGVVLPRMAFEIKNLAYDPSRKLNTNTRNVNSFNGTTSVQSNPVPYNIDIDLYVYVKNQEDGLQIIEQIVPFFTPQFNVTVNAVTEMNITYDLPIILKNVSYEDNYDGAYTERREIIWTLSFTLELNYYGSIDTTGNGIIKNAIVNFYSDDAMTLQTGSISQAVNPSSASVDEAYTISTVIEGF